MTDHPNVASLQGFFDAVNTGDLEKAASYWAEDCMVHFGGNNPVSGTHKGIEAALDLLHKLDGLVEQYEPLDIMADDRYLAVISRLNWTSEGLPKQAIAATAYKVNPEGKFTEFWYLSKDQAALDALLA